MLFLTALTPEHSSQ